MIDEPFRRARYTPKEKDLLLDLIWIAEAQPVDEKGNGQGDYQAFDKKTWKRLAKLKGKIQTSLPSHHTP